MKVLIDTSVIIEIDRRNEEVISFLKKLTERNVDLVVSAITLSEIFAGSYMQKDFKKSVIEAKKILSQFLWIDFDSQVAEKTGQLVAYLIAEGKPVEYQDIAISATFYVSKSDYLVTLNKSHFVILPEIKNKVFTPHEFKKMMK